MANHILPLAGGRSNRHALRDLGERRGAWRAVRRGIVRKLKRDHGLWVWAGAALALATAFFAAAGVAARW
jgi:hypothetical protein